MKSKRILLFGSLGLLVLLAIAVWFFQFTLAGYRMTVPYRTAFESISDHIYINKGYSGNKEEIITLAKLAEERDKEFFGSLQCMDDTIMIFCDDDLLISKLGGDHDTLTVSFPSLKHYISVSEEYLDIDILAHELTHAEFHSRLTAMARSKVPLWFDEGLALQNDYREQYGEESWIVQTNHGKNIVPLEEMDEPAEFYAGTKEDRRFRYLNAKHVVSGWMESNKLQGLLELIDRLNHGEEFSAAYNR